MKTLVTGNNLEACKLKLRQSEQLGLDTETYGVKIHDDMFALQIATEKQAFYFNLHPLHPEPWMHEEILDELDDIFADTDKTWFIHNAKFDLHRLANHDKEIAGRVHCTQATARLIYNQHMRYSLDACLKRRGRAKNPVVENYIKEHRLWTMVTLPYKSTRVKNKHYDQVPYPIMFEYGCDDAFDVLWLGQEQIKEEIEPALYEQECKLVKTCLAMERKGIQTDPDYARKGIDYEQEILNRTKAQASAEAQEEFRNGPKWLRAAFDRCGQPYDLHPKTGNPIFDKHALGKMQSPIAGLVKEIRRSEKYVGTYYGAFLNNAVGDSILHATIRQAGTDTGRFSYADPNLQNIPKEEDFSAGSIQVRKCFTPRQGHKFVMIDFDQQEFRLMLDYAGQHDLIRKIMEHGEDVHQATADMCGIARKKAKTLNFGLLYGMGVGKLAIALGISAAEAKDLKKLYFSRLPMVRKLIQDIQFTAENRGFVKTWAGRKLYFPDKELCYKAPNHLIQGGCGDIARKAMNIIHETLAFHETSMLVQVHDEILFEVPDDEEPLIDPLRQIMETVYRPINGMKLTCGVEYSPTSWGKQDIIDGKPRS